MDSKKDINISFNSQDAKNGLVIKVFEKDGTTLFIYKKIERIVAAIYLVTGIVDEDEGLRQEIRMKSLEVLERSLLLGTEANLKTETLGKLAVDLIHMATLINVAFVSGLFSEMNFIVIKKEIDHLIDLINTKYLGSSNVNRDTLLDREFFTVPSHQFSGSGLSGSDPVNDKEGYGFRQIGSWGDLMKFKDNEYKSRDENKKDGTSPRIGPLKDKDTQGVPPMSVSGDRRSKIVDLLKSKDRLTIKDFLTVITGVSEKTIQRELLKMVALGVLKKEGERRWSRYSIA